VHLLVFDAERIELRFDGLLTALSRDSLSKPPFELGGHGCLLLTLPLLGLEVHLLLILSFQLTEPDTLALVESRLLGLRDSSILQRLELALGLAH
jgi:hypothetical protein